MTLITWRKYDRSDGTKKAYHEDQVLFMDDFDEGIDGCN